MSYTDTIAAISTPPGTGAIGIIRVSGDNSFSIATKVLRRNGALLSMEEVFQSPRKALYLEFFDPIHSRTIDKMIALFFLSPHSYTGEDMLELHFHGNPILLKEALTVLLEVGARPAEPGEFTKRALWNGKIHLPEAEALGRLIQARSSFELQLARKNYFGELSRLSSRLRSQLIGIKAEWEAEIDFSTEDLTFESREERLNQIQKIIELTKNLLESSKRAEQYLQKFKIVILGEPNAGKSSLMNLLLGRERAIISPIPGTTRDYITDEITLAGIPIQLVDTAGVRETLDSIEKEGIQRTLLEAKKANLKIFLIDCSGDQNWTEFIQRNKELLDNSFIVFNKNDKKSNEFSIDLWNKEFPNNKKIFISCKTKEGIPELIQAVEELLSLNQNADDYNMLEERQKYHFQKMLESLEKAVILIQSNAPPEIVAEELNESIREVSSVMGEITTEEILGRIFSVFCVGK